MLIHLVVFISGYLVIIRGCVLPQPIMFNFVDVSAKIPSGILAGNLADLGSFDACLALDETHNGDRYKGKYCLLKVSVPPDIISTGNDINQYVSKDPETIENRTEIESSECGATPCDETSQFDLILGWCIPHSCSIKDAEDYIKNVIGSELQSQSKENITIRPFASDCCQTKDQLDADFISVSPADIFTIVFLSVIGCIMVLSTSYDIYLYFSDKTPAHDILTAFSLKRNVRKLLAVSPANTDPLLCLAGMRYARMMWIIFENRYSLDRGKPFVYFSDLRNFQVENMFIMGADQSADTLFFINGLCVAYDFLKAHAEGKRFNAITFWLRKYVKLAPVMAVMVLTYATILNRFGSGPFWPIVLTPMKQSCVDNWWATLLYVQNYYEIDNICIGQSWFFSVDNQMFFLSPAFLVLLSRWPKCMLYVASVVFLGSILSPLLTSFYNELPAPAGEKYLHKSFIPTHIRFGAWFMGLVFGYILYNLKDNKYKLPPGLVALGWVVSFSCLLLTLLLPHYLMHEHNDIINAFFNGLHRQIWTLGLAWLVYACAHGCGGVINSILSCAVFQSLGRLTYIMYVTHVAQQFLTTALSRVTIYYSDFDVFYKSCGDVLLTTAISAILYLAFEAPMVVVDRLLFEGKPSEAEPEIPASLNQQNEGEDFEGEVNEGEDIEGEDNEGYDSRVDLASD